MLGIARSSIPGRRVACRAGAGNAGSVTIRFAIPYRCNFGQHLRVVGGCDTLGNWRVEDSLAMTWTDGDVWSAEMKLPADKEMTVEYKYVVCGDGGAKVVDTAWKPGANFVITLPGGGNGSVKVKDAWDEASREVQIETIKGGARGRRGQGGGSSGSDDSDDDALAAISTAADSALEQLEAAVNMSFELLEGNGDAGSTELLAADRLVAAAAQRAATMTKALDVAGSPRLASKPGRK